MTQDLETLIAPASGSVGEQFLRLALGQITPSPTNPRKHFNLQRLAELASSIEVRGVDTPLTVRPNPAHKEGDGRPPYELVTGERRWRACGLLLDKGRTYPGHGTVPVLVRHYTDAEVLLLMAEQALENVQREPLHPLEEADHYHLMLSHPRNPATVPEVAQLIGKSTSYVQARLNLRRLAPEAREAFLAGLLDFSKALRVSAMPTAQQPGIVQHITTWGGEPMGVRAAERFIVEQHTLQLVRAPWALDDAQLVPEAGSCTDCGQRTERQPGLFESVTDGDRCLDGTCWARKRQAHHEWLVRNAEAEGYQIARNDRAAAIMQPGSTLPADGWHDLSARVPAHLGDSTLTVEQAIDRAGVDAEQITVLDQPGRERLVHLVTTAVLRTALSAIGAAKSERPAFDLQGQATEPAKPSKAAAPAPAHAAQAAAPADDEADPLLAQATELVLREQRPSISLIQRHLQIGYNRAARLLEAMQAAGLVSAMQPDGTRTITSTQRAAPVATPPAPAWNPLDDLLAFAVLPPGRCDDAMTERCRSLAIQRTAAGLATHRACSEIRDRGPQLNALLPAGLAAALCISLWAGFDFEDMDMQSLADLARLAGITSHPPSREGGVPWPDHTRAMGEWVASLDRMDATCLAYAMVAHDYQQLPAGHLWQLVARAAGIAPEPVLAEATATVDERLRLELMARAATAPKAKTKASKPPAKKAAPAAKHAPPSAAKRQAVKYRNAATGETWSGRGLQPRWLKAALAEGAQLSDFEVQP